MAAPAFAGSLQAKKKAELQEIASALSISDIGTKEELQNRIKAHLEKHQEKLEEEPAFAGLFGRLNKRKRQGSEKPAPSRFAPDEPPKHELSPARSSRRSNALETVREITPVEEEAPVEEVEEAATVPFLDRIGLSAPDDSGALVATSPRRVRDLLPKPDEIISISAVKLREESAIVLQQGNDMLLTLRGFLSNSRNIWSLTAVFEVLYILHAIIPWARFEVPLSPTSVVGIPYPPLAAFQTSAFWLTLYHWSLPALFIPALFGTLISFRPAPQQSPDNPHVVNMPFDPLTASIIRLAAHIAYPFASVDETSVQGVDVLGWRWRVLGAGVGLAFAFAEAISGKLIPAAVIVEDEDGELTRLQIEA
ncbi:hypothetical protein FIBSPDRAFT_850957 [Athelia psychrophila]|uniref:SAP domain-containing protein n=1 Tax=Athelia psychrophila TaxID=1759441 RepID=A0A166T5V1_9AGAM|nr:hypothetical protein FIBSPDRAFT_850957 [Fibularhizoctonia sp. CBS 109695]